MTKRMYTIQVTIVHQVDVEADNLHDAQNAAQEAAIIDDSFEFVLIDVSSPEIESATKADISLIVAKQREIKEDSQNCSKRDFQKIVCEGEALRNPGKRIKLESGVYFYSPDGSMVTSLRRTDSPTGWVSGYGRREIRRKSLRSLIAKIDRREAICTIQE